MIFKNRFWVKDRISKKPQSTIKADFKRFSKSDKTSVQASAVLRPEYLANNF